MVPVLLAFALACAAADWIAIASRAPTWEAVTRPAAILALLAVAAAQTAGAHDQRAAPFFVIGLAASLAGDVFLMRGDHLFLPGMAAFAVAHIAYLGALTPSEPPDITPAIAIVVALAGVFVFIPIARGLRQSGQARLVPPVAAYSLLISLTVIAAWAGVFRMEWTTARRWLGASGATLFYFSDLSLAWGKFVSPERANPVATMIAYHMGQLVLTASFAQV